jgi:hypothetical protein
MLSTDAVSLKQINEFYCGIVPSMQVYGFSAIKNMATKLTTIFVVVIIFRKQIDQLGEYCNLRIIINVYLENNLSNISLYTVYPLS